MSARITDVMVRKAQWAYEREITLAVEAGLSADGLSEARTGAIRAALAAALSTEPGEAEGWRSMDSAPKIDGKRIFIGIGNRLIEAWWGDGFGEFLAVQDGCVIRTGPGTRWHAYPSPPAAAAPLPEDTHHGR